MKKHHSNNPPPLNKKVDPRAIINLFNYNILYPPPVLPVGQGGGIQSPDT